MGDTLVSWTRYHLTAGFQRVYLYMDDPAEATALQAGEPWEPAEETVLM
jgi:hypothetical protein